MAIAQDTLTGIFRDLSADSSETLAHDGGSGSDRVTITFIYTVDSNITTTMTYNGVSMVQQAQVERGTGANRFMTLFSKFGTSTGTNNIVASFSPNSRSSLGAVTISGANQTDTIDGAATAHQASGTSITANTSPTVDGCVVYGIVETSSDNSHTAGTNTTIIDKIADLSMIRSTDIPIASSGSLPLNINYSAGAAGMAAIVIAPVAAGPSTSIKSLNGLAMADVKSYNGLAMADIKSINGLSNVS